MVPAPERPDLSTRADIVRLVDAFYERVRADAVLGPIFDDVAHTDWSTHLPRMYDFWDTVLLTAGSYHGNPMAVHVDLAGRTPLGEPELARWLGLFKETVNALFVGPGAEDAKIRAGRIASVMQMHLAARG